MRLKPIWNIIEHKEKVVRVMRTSKQMSESIELGVILALAGGFMDAYSYLFRDRVFANAQTGNILLMGINLSEGNLQVALRYLFPVMSFALGIALADFVRLKSKEKNHLHWRQATVLCEAIALFLVGFISKDLNLLANSITSFACGIQVETVRKIQGNGIATTMCIGNLRSATQNIMEYHFTRNKEQGIKGLLYLFIILCFVIGAVLGNLCVKFFAQKAILICSGIVMIAFAMMFFETDKIRD